jgi:hypothetical protein
VDDLDALVPVWSETWREHALCRGRTSLFYDRGALARAEALALCRCCPVSEPCRAFGEGEEHGVWGGVPRGPRMRSGTGWRARKREREAAARAEAEACTEADVGAQEAS